MICLRVPSIRQTLLMLNRLKSLRRVVITGMGCVTPIGLGRQEFWTGLQNGQSGVSRIETFDVSYSSVKSAAQVRVCDWEAQLGPKDRKHVPRTVPLGGDLHERIRNIKCLDSTD